MKDGNGLLPGGPMDTDGSNFSVPALQLLIGIDKGTKFLQGQKVTFNVFYSGLHDSLLFRLSWRTG